MEKRTLCFFFVGGFGSVVVRMFHEVGKTIVSVGLVYLPTLIASKSTKCREIHIIPSSSSSPKNTEPSSQLPANISGNYEIGPWFQNYMGFPGR